MQKKILGLFLIAITLCLSVGGTWISSMVLSRSNQAYQGVSVVLDAGHGGKDKGAQFDGVYESEINLKLVQLLKEGLEEVGMHVILTRENEKDLSEDGAISRKSSDMKNRIKIINQEEVDLYISVHMNSFVDSNVHGSSIFYKKGNEDSKVFASYIQNNIQKFTKSNMEIKTGDYYILNKTDKIGILLECGFLSNREDRLNFTNENYQKQFVKEVKKGILQFMKDIYE